MNKQEYINFSLNKGLKVLREDGKTILEISGVHGNSIIFTEGHTSTYGNLLKSNIICRPLSDLTKPIEHNGETFVPIVELWRIGYGNGNSVFNKFEYVESPTSITCHTFSTGYLFHFMKPLMENKFWIIQKLIEWHFNLMDESQPLIDVNTLETNPYK